MAISTASSQPRRSVKVLLLAPPVTTSIYARCERPTMYTPLGLGYLAAVARQHGHHPAVLDCLAEGWRTQTQCGRLVRYGLSPAAIVQRVRTTAPDIVGITAMFSGFGRDVNELAATVRQACPDVPLIVGGADATADSARLLENPAIDLVVRGEGEGTFVALLAHFAQYGSLPEDLAGTTTRKGHYPDAEQIADLDALPMPARDLLAMDIYQENQRSIMPYAKRVPIGFVMSSRGCPYDCIFCSTRNVWRRWRPRSASNVGEEMEVLVNEYGAREIAFLDDSFVAWPPRVEEICNEIQRRNLRIAWSVPVGLTIWRVTPGLLRAMRDTGFYRACFPIESGDPGTLEYIRKPIDLDEVRETIAACHRLGIWSYGNFIIGFPEESPESVENTIEFAANCGLDMVNAYIAQPYKGAELWDTMAQMGFLDPAAETSSTIFDTAYDTAHFTAAELRRKRDELYARFTKRRIRRLFTPRGMLEMLRKVNSPSRFVYGMRVFTTFAKNSLISRKFTIIPESAASSRGDSADAS